MSGVVEVRDQGGDVCITWEEFSRSSYCESRFFFIFTEERTLKMKLHLKEETGRNMWKFYITKDDENMNVTADVRVNMHKITLGHLTSNGLLLPLTGNNLKIYFDGLKITRKVEPPIALDLTPALEDDTYSDCILVCGEETLKAHKLILATRSSVFRAMFDTDMIEGRESRVVVEDLEVPVVKGLLKYLYSNQVEEEISSGLLEAAEKYDLQDLKSACEVVLKKSITKDNAVDILQLADLFRADYLKEAAVEFIVQNRKSMQIIIERLPVTLSTKPELLATVLMAFTKI